MDPTESINLDNLEGLREAVTRHQTLEYAVKAVGSALAMQQDAASVQHCG